MKIIGIAGGSGSGKTTIIQSVESQFDKENVQSISMDNYYKPIHLQPVDVNGIENFDLPECFEFERFVSDVNRLKNGETIEIKEYVFNNDQSTAKYITIVPPKVLMIEGLFIFNSQTTNLFDYRIIIKADPALQLIRRIRRDILERNYPLEDVTYRYEHHVIPSFNTYVSPYLNTVDMILNNIHNIDIPITILHSLVEKLLKN